MEGGAYRCAGVAGRMMILNAATIERCCRIKDLGKTPKASEPAWGSSCFTPSPWACPQEAAPGCCQAGASTGEQWKSTRLVCLLHTATARRARSRAGPQETGEFSPCFRGATTPARWDTLLPSTSHSFSAGFMLALLFFLWTPLLDCFFASRHK